MRWAGCLGALLLAACRESLVERAEKAKTPQEKIRLLDQSIAQNQDLPYAYRLRAEAYVELRQPHKALEDCRAALDMSPDYDDARIYLADVLQADLGQMKEARAEYVKVIVRRPKDKETLADAYAGIADIEYEDGNFDKVIELCERSLSIHPTGSAHHRLAMTFNLTKNFERASEHMRKYLEYFPEDQFDWALILANMGKAAQAREVWKTLKPEPNSYFAAARYHAVMGEPAQALKYLEDHLTQYDVVPETRNQTRQFCARDWHFDSLRNDPRFRSLVSARD